MPTENERKDIQKAMAYDLLRILKQNPEKAWALPVYEYLRQLSARVEANASASAMSGALAAYCGGLLFAQS